jgi:hypothetical protein
MSINTRPLEHAEFRNTFVEELHGEIAPHKRPRQVPGACYSQVEPTPVRDPHLLAWSDDFAAYLGIEKPAERGTAIEILGGNRVLPSMKPFAARYAGHQFGTGPGSWVMDARFRWAKWKRPTARGGKSSLKAPGLRPTRVAPMAALFYARRCASSCAAKPCIIWASHNARSQSGGNGRHRCARHVLRRQSAA